MEYSFDGGHVVHLGNFSATKKVSFFMLCYKSVHTLATKNDNKMLNTCKLLHTAPLNNDIKRTEELLTREQ